MTEVIQLSMFMTTEQQKMVDRYIAEKNRDAEQRALKAQLQTSILMAGGLRPNVHFNNTFEIEENVTETVSLGGRYYDVEEFEAEVTYNKATGGVVLLYDMVGAEDGERKVVKKDTWFAVTPEGKVECSPIVGTYRAVKPETVLRKLDEMATAAKDRLVMINQKAKHFDNAIATLKLEFPNAVNIERGSEWVSTHKYRNSYFIDVVTVAFEDGSYIQYDVNNFSGEIKIRKVYDVVVESLTSQDKVNNLKDRLAKA